MSTSSKGFAPETVSNEWRTPKMVFHAIEKHFNMKFKVDLCASAQNTLCTFYVDSSIDVLTVSPSVVGTPGPGFMNPPYNLGNLWDFVRKAAEIAQAANVPVAVLIPASKTDQPGFAKIIREFNPHIAFMEKRIPFLRADGTGSSSPNHPSMVLAFGVLQGNSVITWKE